MTTIDAVDPARVLSTLRGADMVLAAAQAGELPMPFNVSISDVTTTATFLVWTLDELTQWAIWLDEVIKEDHVGTSVHHRVVGTVFDQPVRVIAITDPEPATHEVAVKKVGPWDVRAECTCGWHGLPGYRSAAEQAGAAHIAEVSA